MSDNYLKCEIGFLLYKNNNSMGAIKLTDIKQIEINNKNTSVYNVIINGSIVSDIIIENSDIVDKILQIIINNIIYHIKYDFDKNLNINELINESMKKEYMII